MADNIKEIVSWMGLIGLPPIFTAIVAIVRALRKYSNQIQVLCKAQQAQMRAQLLDQYHFFVDRGWISEEEMEEWENQYQGYHSLGNNGVLDKRREKLMALPSVAPTKKKRRVAI